MNTLTKVSIVALAVVGFGIYTFSDKNQDFIASKNTSADKPSYISHTEISNNSTNNTNNSLASKNSAAASKADDKISHKEELSKRSYEGMMSAKAKSMRQKAYYMHLHQQRVAQQNAIMQRHKEQQKAIAMNMMNQQRVKNNTLQMNQLKYKRMNEQNIQKEIFQNKKLNENS